VTDRIGIVPGRVHAPVVDAPDLAAAAAGYDAAITAAGGVDLQLLGVGANGHIAFNEPGAPLDGATHVAELTEQTRRDNARFFGGDPDAVPRRAMTQGIGTILRARRVLLLASGEAKAVAVAGLVGREPTVDLPVTALHLHPAVTVLLDPAAAARIDERAVLPTVRLHGAVRAA
jgi:glucosamine-6-phosphate deaminase